MTEDRSEQEAWEDAELLPIMTTDARRWFLTERERRKKGPTPPAAPESRPRNDPRPGSNPAARRP